MACYPRIEPVGCKLCLKCAGRSPQLAGLARAAMRCRLGAQTGRGLRRVLEGGVGLRLLGYGFCMSDLLIDAIRDSLAGLADPDSAPGKAAYLKSEIPVLGVRNGDVRKVVRENARIKELQLVDQVDWVATIRGFWNEAEFREELLAAIELSELPSATRLGWHHPDQLDLYRHMVVTGAWWDLVDPIATHRVGYLLLEFPDEVTPTLEGWSVADDFWVRRTAILAPLKHKEETDLTYLRLAIENNLQASQFGKEFFIRKAIGWVLREQSKTNPAWVRSFIEQHRGALSGLSIREASKYLP